MAMNWNSLEQFLAMGGYGYFVWMSYGAALALIVGEVASVRLRRRRALAQAADRARGANSHER
jgi:heme exporter protein D